MDFLCIFPLCGSQIIKKWMLWLPTNDITLLLSWYTNDSQVSGLNARTHMKTIWRENIICWSLKIEIWGP